MLRFYKAFLLICFVYNFKAQNSSTDPQFEAQVIGGKQQIEQILETQMNLPKALVSPGFKYEFITFFDLDSSGQASHILFDGPVHQSLKKEMLRLFRFWKFRITLDLPGESRPYFLKFDISSEKYKHYIKQQSRFTIKTSEPEDSSLAVYSKADRSPVFCKNGEEGFADYILNEMDYPKLAIERSIEGTVIVDFIVETNGFVSALEVKKGVNGGCTEEALRLLRVSRWKPASLNNKLVRYKMACPITFNLRNINRSNESSGSTLGQ